MLNLLSDQGNANQNHFETPSYTCQNMLERMWSKGNTHPLMVGMQTCATTLEISMTLSQKIGNQPTSGSNSTTFGNIPKRCSTILQKHFLTMFIATLFLIEPGNNLDAPQPKNG